MESNAMHDAQGLERFGTDPVAPRRALRRPPGPFLTWLELGGRSALQIDFRETTGDDDQLSSIQEAREAIAQEPEGSLLTLTVLPRVAMSPRVIDALKQLAADNKPYVHAAALVGLKRIERILYNLVMIFSGRDIKTFDTVEEARSWLSQQRPS